MNLDLPLPENIFSEVAQSAAKQIAGEATSTKNKSTQLRRFYDELVMWHDKLFDRNVKNKEETYKELAPFIKMMCAKVAYAKGRGHVSDGFEKLFSDVIKAVKNPTTLKHAKLFVEAFMGFYKAEGK
ncbi:MAG: type III-A CRISPR-associated protein Csm2 [Zoogloeaceae bacterium]|jgi:CRISPR-associated protein Csm2|nr:type III-A CRISPR-associated protein Csm2 [Zoogloeaceae bacterium]